MTEEQPFLRNHWSYVASNTFRTLLMFGVMILVWWGTSEGRGDMTYYLAFILVMLVIIVALNIIYWAKTKYYFLEDEIVVIRTTIFRSETRIQYDRLASVNVERDVVCRILNATKLSFNLNSSMNVTKAEAYIVLKKDRADRLREDLNSRMFGTVRAVNDDEEVPQEEAVSLVDVSTWDIFLHAFIGMSTYQLLFGLAMAAYSILSFYFDNSVSVFAIILFVVEFLMPAFAAFFRYYDYSIVRQGDTVTVSSGFFSTRTDCFKLSKVNFVKIREPLLCRVLGKSILEAEVVGTSDTKGMPLLCPLKDSKVAYSLFRDLLPEFACEELQAKQRRISLVALGFWTILSLAVVAVFAYLLVPEIPSGFGMFLNFCVVLLYILCVGWFVLAYRNRSIAMNDSIVLAVTGSFDRVSNYILFDKIQFANVFSNPVERRYGAAKCKINMLSTVGATAVVTGVFEADYLEKVSETVMARIRDGRYDFRRFQ
jgi:putative membrane protein